MATKRKRTKEQNVRAGEPAREGKPERRPVPRKRADAPKPARSAVSPARAAEVPEEGGDDSASPRSSRAAAKRRVAKPHKRRWPLVVVGVILALVVGVVAVFSWDRWLRYDDASEFQGEWRTHGAAAVVVIDGESIKLTDDVAFSYTLDTGAKTIAFSFGTSEGQGRYRFSLDRSQLVITDGEGYSWLSTLVDDISWMVDQAKRSIADEPQEQPVAAENVAVLDRLSHNASASPRVEPTVTGATDAQNNDEGGANEPAAGQEDSKPKSDDANASASPRNLFDVSDVGA